MCTAQWKRRRTRAACTFPSSSATHALLSSRASASLYPSSAPPSSPSRPFTHAGMWCAGRTSPAPPSSSAFLSVLAAPPTSDAGTLASGTCRFGSRPSSAPDTATSQRTAIAAGWGACEKRRARKACHLRHSTSLLSRSAPLASLWALVGRGGCTQSVGVRMGWAWYGECVGGYV